MMKTNTMKKISLFALSIVMIFALAVGLTFNSNVLADASDWKVASTLTQTEDGVYVNTSTSGSHTVEYVGTDIAQADTAEFTVQYTEASSADGGSCYMAWQIFYGDGAEDYYIFKLCFNIGHGENAVALFNQYATTKARHNFGKKTAFQEWLKIKIVLKEGVAQMYAGDELIVNYTNIGNITWKKAIAHIYSVPAQMKDLKVYKTVTEEDLTEGWKINEEVSEANGVYTTTTGAANIEYKNGDFTNVNTLFATFKYTGNPNGNIEYVGFRFFSEENDYYTFGLWPNSAAAGASPVTLIQKNETDPIKRILRLEHTTQECGSGVTFTMKVVIMDNYFAYYINNNLLATSDNANFYGVGEFTWRRVVVVTEGCSAEISALEFSNTEVNFDTEEGWKTNDYATEAEENGKVVYTTANSDSVANIEYKNGDFTNVNTISATINYAGSAASNDEYFAYDIYDVDGNFYRFSIWPNSASGGNDVVFVQKNTKDPIDRLHRIEVGSYTDVNKDVKVTLILQSKYFAFYIDNHLVTSIDDFVADRPKFDTIEWSRVMISTRNNATKISNLELSYTVPYAYGFEMATVGASIRISNPTGIRFLSQFTTEEYNALIAKYGAENVELGTLTAKTAELNGADLTLENGFAIKCETYFGVNGEYTQFTGVLAEIPETDYATDITARAYLKITSGETVYVIYSDAIVRSISYVANLAYNNEQDTAAYQNAIVGGFIVTEEQE